MPNKTIYIKNEHLSLFDQAQTIAGGDSVSAVIVEALREFVRREEARKVQANKETVISELIQGLLQRAVEARASDIHLQPTRSGNQVRLRVDGVLQDDEPLPQARYADVIERMKALTAHSTEVGAPSRGGILSLQIDGQPIDVRISVVESILGPSLTARILLPDASLPTLEHLEPEAEHAESLRRLTRKSHGLILLTGSTGSGKTTTVYSLLKAIDRQRNKVMTVEDPVEAIIDDCVQITLNRRQGPSLAPTILQAMLGDFDVLYASEIRDGETAELLVKCALTGHLVVSSLHASSAIRAWLRLIDAGVAPFMVRDAVTAIVGQRLVRRLCLHCKNLDHDPHPQLAEWGLSKEVRFYRAVGCERCGQTGFRGRMALLEIFEPSESLGRALVQGQGADELERQARSEGMKSLLDDGLDKAARGHTSLTEVLRVTG